MKRQDRRKKESLKKDIQRQQREVGSIEQLESMLAAEMAKDPVDIDTDYADVLAEMILEYRQIPAANSAPSAGRTAGLHGWNNIIRVAAIMIVLCAILLGPAAYVAEAFGWISIVRFLSPLMEQIGIHVNLDLDDEMNRVSKPDETGILAESEAWDEIVDQVLADEKALPDDIEGFPVRPLYLPEGYRFVRAELFSDASLTNINMTYSDGKQEMYINIKLYAREIGSSTMMTEQRAEQPAQSRIVATSDEGINTIIMDCGFSRYMAWGSADEAELYKIMEAYEGAICK